MSRRVSTCKASENRHEATGPQGSEDSGGVDDCMGREVRADEATCMELMITLDKMLSLYHPRLINPQADILGTAPTDEHAHATRQVAFSPLCVCTPYHCDRDVQG